MAASTTARPATEMGELPENLARHFPNTRWPNLADTCPVTATVVCSRARPNRSRLVGAWE